MVHVHHFHPTYLNNRVLNTSRVLDYMKTHFEPSKSFLSSEVNYDYLRRFVFSGSVSAASFCEPVCSSHGVSSVEIHQTHPNSSVWNVYSRLLQVRDSARSKIFERVVSVDRRWKTLGSLPESSGVVIFSGVFAKGDGRERPDLDRRLMTIQDVSSQLQYGECPARRVEIHFRIFVIILL